MMLCIVRVAVRLLLAREADLSSASGSGSSNADTSNRGPLGMVDVMVDEYRADGQVSNNPTPLFAL